ncbi:MAG: serine hydrolase [SAR86 cluster bacterium]|uniref:Serine hydrolase n=1 Tax=SAR86 cluster bacterium TaxID=2030880 RepID=A0A2A4MGY1_9GAMM|nr:MAG: serine hydrolase [SAR86 cluster bacterium]
MSSKIALKRTRSLAVAALMLSFSTGWAADIGQDRLDAIAADLQSRVDEGRLAGVVAMVAKDGEVIMNQAFGYRDLENQVEMTTDSIFRIFSMTKPIAGTALMTLYDEGKFQLSDPVEKYIPEFANLRVFNSQNADGSIETVAADHAMTIRELVSHTGGLAYTPPLSSGPIADAYVAAHILDRDVSLKDMIPALGDIPLATQPGAQWVYSISVDVQGYLVEVLSGQSFDEFLQQRIFTPLNMSDTSFYVSADKAHRLSRSYGPDATGKIASPENGAFLEKPAFFSGGGGLTSTASDYMKFAQMHLNGGILDGTRILSNEAIELMRSNQMPAHIDGIGPIYPGNVFGIDFAVVNDSEKFDGASEGSHWWWGIAGTWFWIDPVENIIFISMIQNSDLFYSLQTHAKSRQLIYRPL